MFANACAWWLRKAASKSWVFIATCPSNSCTWSACTSDTCSSKFLQLPLQRFARTRQMRLHRTLAAAHRLRGAGDIELLEHPQREGFALAPWQGTNRRGDPIPGLSAVVMARWIRTAVGPVDGVRVALLLRREPAQPERASSLQVDDAAAQNAPEQRRPFGRGSFAIGQHFHHRVLHRIECILALAQSEFGEAECPRADASEEGIERCAVWGGHVAACQRRARLKVVFGIGGHVIEHTAAGRLSAGPTSSGPMPEGRESTRLNAGDPSGGRS